MAKEVDSRLDAAMQALQASLIVDDSKRQAEGEAVAPAINLVVADELTEAVAAVETETALDLAELASASDQAASAAPNWALIGGATVVGIAAIVVAADDDDDIEVIGGGGQPTDPTDPTDPTGPTDPTQPTVPGEVDVNISDELGAGGEFANGGAIVGVDGEQDTIAFNFGVVSTDGGDRASSAAGNGQLITISNLSADDGDTLQFITTASDVGLEEFFNLVRPVTNEFDNTTTLNFLNLTGDVISVVLEIDQAFNVALGVNDDLFQDFFVVTSA